MSSTTSVPRARRARLLALVAGTVLVSGACQDFPAGEPRLGPTGPAALSSVSQDPVPDQLAVAQAVTGFGGYYFDEGVPTVNLTDPSQRPAAESALAGWLASYGYAASDLQVRKVEYSYLQLNDWYNASWRNALAVGGAVFSDLDEKANRLRFGGVDANALAGIASALADASVPGDAVVIELTAPVVQTATLRDVIRPTYGGLQLNFLNVAGVRGVSFLCTLGFNAISGTTKSFVTNSHCSDVQGGSETQTEYFQPVMDPDGDRLVNRELYIAEEVHDPHYFISLDCPPGRTCRYSDASRAQYDSAQVASFQIGRIARPVRVSDFPRDTALTIDDTNPTFRIVAEQRNQVVGEIVNKVGRTTGWTAGAVTATCVNVNITASQITQLCQNRAAQGVGGGDSGSPEFTLNTDGTVNLAGILWGSSTNLVTGQVSSIYSPLANVERELGDLATEDPIPVTTKKKKPK